MSDLAYQLAIWVPASAIVWVLVWYVFKMFGTDTGSATIGPNLRTWPFGLALAAGANFGLIVGVAEFALAESSWGRIFDSVVAAVVSVIIVPRLWARLFPTTLPSSQRDKRGASIDE